MTTTAVPAISLSTLRAAVAGRVLTPDSQDYAGVSMPWNVAAASTPIAVVEALGAADVSATVRFAASIGCEVAVQATGHGAAVSDRPTIMVQTSRMAEVSIDAAKRTARVGAGARWQQVLDAAAEHGLAALSGSAPGVGVVGYTTGGGLSPVSRTFGYAADHVTGFDVVTGDGELRRATATENPALFWGLRGGKGALGIVTSIEFDLFDVPEIYGGALYFDGADSAAVLRAWTAWSADLPRAATTSIAILRLPAMPMVPPPLAGRVTVAVRFAWVGDPDEGARVVAPITDLAPVLLGGMGVMPFAALGSIHADPVDPMPVHERAILLRELPDDAIVRLLGAAGVESGSPLLVVELRRMGGAIGDLPESASAVCHRDAAFTLLAIGVLAPPIAEATVASAAMVVTALEPWSGGMSQPNFGGALDAARVSTSYDTATLHRLATLAVTYDPAGVLAAARPLRVALAGGM